MLADEHHAQDFRKERICDRSKRSDHQSSFTVVDVWVVGPLTHLIARQLCLRTLPCIVRCDISFVSYFPFLQSLLVSLALPFVIPFTLTISSHLPYLSSFLQTIPWMKVRVVLLRTAPSPLPILSSPSFPIITSKSSSTLITLSKTSFIPPCRTPTASVGRRSVM